jgi:hypothetical protein
MPIFKWVEEIEEIYENLIENAKKESLEMKNRQNLESQYRNYVAK